ncbi:MAG: response regulator [Gammaproteobacteria bacterium]|nr:response regulator [Gammaproteobacteria bacterium]
MTKKTILFVDDDSISRHLIKGFLRDEENYIVKTVASAQECLNFIENNNVDLIISDVEMDDLDGIEMSKILLSKDKTCNIPVILSSIRDQLDVVRKSRDYDNVRKVTQKPYDRNILLSDIKAFCNP